MTSGFSEARMHYVWKLTDRINAEVQGMHTQTRADQHAAAVNHEPVHVPAPVPAHAPSVLDELNKLAAMKASGAITEDDYLALKARIINS